MKTNKPFWNFLFWLILFGIVTSLIVFRSLHEGFIVITQGRFVLIFFLGCVSALFFGIWMKHESEGNPIEEISILKEGVLFEITTHEILYVGKDQEIVHLVHIKYDDDENYDTTKYTSLLLDNSDLENPELFTEIKGWKKITFTFVDGKVQRFKR